MRSFYLDDMDVNPGDQVVCKANLAAEWIEQGAVFTVLAFAVIQGTNGVIHQKPKCTFSESRDMTEPVTIEVIKFKSLDGNLYDTEQEAERADRYWKEHKCTNGIEDEVRMLGTQYRNLLRHQARAKENGRATRFEGVNLVVAYEKHGNSFYMGTGLEGLAECYWRIFKERMDENYGFYSYLEGRQAAIVKLIFETEDKAAAYGFVNDRADYEYERVETESVTVVD